MAMSDTSGLSRHTRPDRDVAELLADPQYLSLIHI